MNWCADNIFGFLGLREGCQQAAILEQMKRSTADTATAMKAATTSLQNLADAQAESLKIFQEEQADRAKKPRLALYVGCYPLAQAHGLLKPRSETDIQLLLEKSCPLKRQPTAHL